MTHSKTFTRSNGDKVKVEVDLCHTTYLTGVFIWRGTRWDFLLEEEVSLYITPEEILQAKEEFWLKLKPTL